MDIATLLESHRKYIMDEIGDDIEVEAIVARAHDRATTRTLLDMYRTTGTANGELKTGQAAPQAAPVAPAPSRKIKPGSKRARDRAAKAQATRQRNLANKKQAGVAGAAVGSGDAPLSPATALPPRLAGGVA